MVNLKFADTHNMVAFLAKPAESEGFAQIVDFLNAHTIKYALTINPTIYSSCIEQLWATVKAKTVNGEVQLQALVDGKKIIITESIVRRDLQLEDAEGVDCLPNATIFEQLILMGSKTTAWNEFSSTMASAIICLATNQKFNFSKYIFESMVKNLENVSGKFLLCPREDLETLYKLVKAKYGSTRPVEDLDLVLYGDLKTMFEPHIEDNERIARIKRLIDDLRVTAAQVYVLGTTTSGNAPSKSSYANVTGKPSGKKLIFHTFFYTRGNGIDVVVPVESIRAINERFTNTTYGFFLGKKVAYPVVANYVRNTYGKYRLVRSMFSSSTALFSFQFSSMDGLDAMLENGSWFIRNNSLILKKWHPNENLMKEDISTVPVWVKLHGVPVMAFSEDGLSAIATKLAMIELRADVELKDNIVVDIPKLTREGHYICNVRIEYEWKPHRCASCKVFGHIHEECPKNIGVGEKKTLKKPSQTSRGVSVGQKMGFKP
ncbi:putative reverse transcriptase domain-containing protein [Tanacetum coccineum]